MREEEKKNLNRNWGFALKYWRIKSVEFNLADWQLQKDHAKTRLGQCDPNKKLITLSTYYLRGPSCNFKSIKNTILHEIAHALTPNHSHDSLWKKVARNIGCDANTRGFMDPPPRNWSLFCMTCKWREEYFRKPNLKGKICRKCGNKPCLKSNKN